MRLTRVPGEHIVPPATGQAVSQDPGREAGAAPPPVGGALRRLSEFAVDAALWVAWFPFRAVVKRLPFRVRYALADVIAFGLYLGAGERRRVTWREVRRFFGASHTEKELGGIVRGSFAIYVKRHIEDLFLGSLTKADVEHLVRVEGQQYLDQALAKGKGVIIQLAHFGSFRMVLPALGLRGYRITQVVGNPELKHHRAIHRKIFNVMVKENQRLPVTFLHVEHSVRPIVRKLQDNELVAIALDGNEGKSWVTVPFLGQPANLLSGSVRIGTVTGATILPVFLVRQRDDTQVLIIEKPFELEAREDREDYLRHNTARLAAIFTGYIERHPTHFGMILAENRLRFEKGIFDVPLFATERKTA